MLGEPLNDQTVWTVNRLPPATSLRSLSAPSGAKLKFRSGGDLKSLCRPINLGFGGLGQPAVLYTYQRPLFLGFRPNPRHRRCRR